MFRIIVGLVLITLTGCGTVVSRNSMNELNDRFESTKEQLEQKAQAGQITWIQAERQIRDLDKQMKSKLDASGARHTWRYDTGDEEYYAYCIALAEQLDNHKITFAQFDVARKQRFNQIQARRQELTENSRPRQQNCITQKEGIAPYEKYVTRCY